MGKNVIPPEKVVLAENKAVKTLTYEQIMALPLRRLDALVAERVEGVAVTWAPDPYRVPDRRLTDHHPWLKDDLEREPAIWTPVKRYSTEWNAVLDVLAAMNLLGMAGHLDTLRQSDDQQWAALQYCACFTPHGLSRDEYGKWLSVIDSSAPLAIVRAALLSVAQCRLDACST